MTRHASRGGTLQKIDLDAATGNRVFFRSNNVQSFWAKFRSRAAAALVALAALWSTPAQEIASVEYLLLIDTSPRMAARQAAVARTVEDFVRTGFRDRIKPGERFAILFFDQLVDTNYPSFTWDPQRVDELVLTVRLLFKITPTPRVGTDLTNVLKSPQRKMMFVLTDGYRNLRGTPFDDAINGMMAAHRLRFERAAKPFLVTLAPRRNEWVAFGVHTNLGAAIEFPVLPPEPIPVAALTQTQAVVVAAAAPPPPVEVVRSEPAPAPKAVEKTPEVPKTEPQPVVVAAPEIVAPPKIIEPPPPAVEARAIVTEAPKVMAVIATPPPEPAPEPVPAAAPRARPDRKIETPPILATALAPAPPPPSFPWGLLCGALAGIGGAGWFAYLRLRPAPKKTGSIISQSLGPMPRPGQKR